jgi:hypothetical protein
VCARPETVNLRRIRVCDPRIPLCTAVSGNMSGVPESTEEVAVTAEEWVRTFAEQIGCDPPGEQQMDEILRLASVAAHASERKAAPIACWLAGTTGRPVAELIPVAEAVPTD